MWSWKKRKPICSLTSQLPTFYDTQLNKSAWCIENTVYDVLMRNGKEKQAYEFYRRSQQLGQGLISYRELFLRRWALAEQYVEIR
jgi:hypothetical protein